MKTIQKNLSGSFKELGSKFIGFLFFCTNEEEFQRKLAGIKKEYPDASHHCYAYRIHPEHIIDFSSDDGEPSGTAGLPILNQLKSFDLVNTGAVVVRYFGGTKLGKPGLIQAYGGIVEHILSNNELSKLERITPIVVCYEYSQEKDIQYLVQQFNLKEQSSSYTENVERQFAVPTMLTDALTVQLEKLAYKGISFEILEPTFEIISQSER